MEVILPIHLLVCNRRYLEEAFVWKVLHQVLLALEECHRKRKGVHKVMFVPMNEASGPLNDTRNIKAIIIAGSPPFWQ